MYVCLQKPANKLKVHTNGIIYILLNLGRLVGLMAPSETLMANSGNAPEIVVSKSRKSTLTGKR